jgi:hypothetical protein
MGVVSLMPPASASAVRARLAEIGALLVGRRRGGEARIRNVLRPLMAIGGDCKLEEVAERFLEARFDGEDNPRTYAVEVALKAPDLSSQATTFSRIVRTLRQFEPCQPQA